MPWEKGWEQLTVGQYGLQAPVFSLYKCETGL